MAKWDEQLTFEEVKVENGKNVVELDIWQDDGTDKNMWGKALVALPAKQS